MLILSNNSNNDIDNDNSTTLNLILKNGDLFEASGYDNKGNLILIPKIMCLEQN